jgi:curli biogenesis system outer membrane secretion channel CsgG
VPEVNGNSASDMFTAALVSSGQFRVLERSQLRGGVVAEKQLNASGQTVGSTAQVQLIDAKYLFEGTVSEANTDEHATQGNLSVGPVGVAGNSSKSSVVIDVRVVEVATGEVVDAITVRKPIYNRGGGINVGGGGVTAGSTSAFASTADAVASTTKVGGGVSTARKDGVGRALRACIEVAVLQLSQRANLEPAAASAAAASPKE